MRQILLFMSLCTSLPAWGLTFQSRLESAEWTVQGDQFECRLAQQVAGFGQGEFVWRAGEPPFFRLSAQQAWLQQGSASLLAAAPPWRPGVGDLPLGQLLAAEGNGPLRSTQQQADRLLRGLLEGRAPEVHYRSAQGDSLKVRLMPVRFAEGYQQLHDCSAKMLPVSFEQIRQSQIGFPNGTELDALGRSKLDIILEYLKADPSVNRIELGGHSDNTGNRLTNRETSRRRALAVKEYLHSKGVPENQITLRFYGERYPLVKNNSEANRARNRRVTLSLSREAAVTEEAPSTPQPPVEQAPPAKAIEPAIKNAEPAAKEASIRL